MRLRVSAGWAVTVLLAAVGCGQTSGAPNAGSGAGSGGAGDEPPVMGLDFVQSGSRVVALGYSSNEARLFRTFHDQELGFDCSFVSEAAGRDQRCVPNKGVRLIYTDAGCTEPAAWVDQWTSEMAEVGDAVRGYSSYDDGIWCPGDPPAHVGAYRVAERLSEWTLGSGDLATYEMRGDSCQRAYGAGKYQPAVHRLTPLPESELARAELVSLNVGDGMRLLRLIADDGAELSVGVTGDDGTACALQRDGECVPEPIAVRARVAEGGHLNTALNSECSVPAFVSSYSARCGAPRFGLEDDGVQPLRVRAVENVTTFFSWELTLPITEPVTYQCTPRESNDVSAPGRDVTGTLPQATISRRGSGPLHVDWFGARRNQLAPVQSRFVNDAGQACEVMPAVDGTLHCAVLAEHTGLPTAEIATFPLVTPFTY